MSFRLHSTLAAALGAALLLLSFACGRGSGSPAQPSATPSARTVASVTSAKAPDAALGSAKAPDTLLAEGAGSFRALLSALSRQGRDRLCR